METTSLLVVQACCSYLTLSASQYNSDFVSIIEHWTQQLGVHCDSSVNYFTVPSNLFSNKLIIRKQFLYLNIHFIQNKMVNLKFKNTNLIESINHHWCMNNQVSCTFHRVPLYDQIFPEVSEGKDILYRHNLCTSAKYWPNCVHLTIHFHNHIHTTQSTSQGLNKESAYISYSINFEITNSYFSKLNVFH